MSFRAFCSVFVCIAATGCFGKSAKVDTDKLKSVKSVAIVGVCSIDEMGTRKAGAMLRQGVPAGMADTFAEGFHKGFGAAYTQAKLTPLAEAASAPSFPKGTVAAHSVCAQSVSPFMPPKEQGMFASYAPVADAAVMKAMADALGVDLVVAVMAAPGVEFDGNTKMFSGGMNQSMVWAVDRAGEVVLELPVEAEVESPGETDASVEGAVAPFGEAIGKQVAEKMAGS